MNAADLLLAGQARDSDIGRERMDRVIDRLKEIDPADLPLTICAVVAFAADSIGELTDLWARGVLKRDDLLWMLLSKALDRET